MRKTMDACLQGSGHSKNKQYTAHKRANGTAGGAAYKSMASHSEPLCSDSHAHLSLPQPGGVDSSGNCVTQLWHCVTGSVTYQLRRRSKQTGINSVSKIDRVAKVLFPVSFVTFHVVYWMAYLDTSSPGSSFAA